MRPPRFAQFALPSILVFGVGYFGAVASHAKLLAQLDQVASVLGLMVVLADLGYSAVCGRRLTDVGDDTHSRTVLIQRVTVAFRERSRATDDERLWLQWFTEGTATGRNVPVSGGMDNLYLLFRSVRDRRLIIIGPAGSGKSTLAVRFAGELLRRLSGDDPVPVVVPALTWQVERESFEDWLVARILLLDGGGGLDRDAVRRLVRRGDVLPVLDDLDELPPKLRRSALTAISRYGSGSAVVVMRDAAWHAERASLTALWRDVLVVNPVKPEDGFAYLCRAYPSDPVLGRPPKDLETAARLAGVLTTPFEYVTARRGIRRRCRPRGMKRQVIERWLTDEALAYAYGDASGEPEAIRRRFYLRTVARMTTREDSGIAWWHLQSVLPRPLFGVILGLVAAIVVGAFAVWNGVAGYVAVLAVVLATAGSALLSGPPRPRCLGARTMRFPGGLWLASLTAGFLETALRPRGTVTQAVVVGVALILTQVAMSSVCVPADPERETCPRQLLRADLAANVVHGCAVAVAVALLYVAALRWLGLQVRPSIVIPLSVAVLMVHVVRSAAVWYLTALTVLAVFGRLPMRLLVFLDDGRDRGVLRRVGPIYQFRYAFVQRRITDTVGTGSRRD